MASLLIDRPDDHVLRILINRPAKLNAVDFEVRSELIEAFATGLADPRIRAVVFGGVDGNLSAGGDVPSMVGLTQEEAHARLRHGHRLCRLIAETGTPIVTAAQGVAAGACLGLALLGDYIVGGPVTKVMIPFFKLGLVPDWGLSRSLPLRVGLPAARRLIFEARTIRGEEAERLGLIDVLVDDDKVMDTAVAKAKQLAQAPRQALALLKDRWRQGPLTFEADLAREEADQVACLLGDEFKEGGAAFLEKRAADFARM